MQKQKPNGAETGTGSCTVVVALGEWRGFRHHAPSWWPKDPQGFTGATPALLRRVQLGLEGRLAS